MASFSSSAGIVAKFSTIAGGVWIEQAETPLGTTRVWRFLDAPGRAAEWADLADIQSGNPAPRFYGSQFTSKDFVLC